MRQRSGTAKAPTEKVVEYIRRRTRKLSCCRFRGHEEKIVTMELESGYEETKVQPRVQD
jgi:hypothetical protein